MISKLKHLAGKRKNLVTVAIYGVTTVLQRLTGLILTLFNAYFISPSEVGIYGVVISLSILFGIISDAGLSTAVLRTYYDHHQDPDASRRYISRLITGARLLAWGILLCLLLVGIGIWDILTSHDAPVWPYLPITLAITFFMRHAQLLGSICRVTEKQALYFIGQISMIGVSIAMSVLLVVVFKFGVVGALIAYLAGQAVSAVIFSATVIRGIGIKPEKPVFTEIYAAFMYGAPLAISQLAAWGRNVALRVILVHLVTLSQVGVFFVTSQIAYGFVMLTQAIDFTFLPKYYKARVRGDHEAKARALALSRLTLSTLVPVYVSIAAFSHELIAITLPASYLSGAAVLAILLVASFLLIQSTVLVHQLNYLKKTALVPIFTTIPVILSLLGIPTAVEFYGLAGAAWTVVAGNAATILIGNLLVIRYEKSDHAWLTALLTTSMIIVAAGLVQVNESGIFTTFAHYNIWRAAIVLTAFAFAATILWHHRQLVRQILTK